MQTLLTLANAQLVTRTRPSSHWNLQLYTCTIWSCIYALYIQYKDEIQFDSIHHNGIVGGAWGQKNNPIKWKVNWFYLDNLLIRHAGHQEILFVLIRVELDAVRHLPVGEAGNTLACRRERWKGGSFNDGEPLGGQHSGSSTEVQLSFLKF